MRARAAAAAALVACAAVVETSGLDQEPVSRFWTQLATGNGDALQGRKLPAVAYCAELDTMLVAYGYGDGSMREDLALYDFESGSYTTLMPPSEMVPRYGANLVNVDVPQGAGIACRFLLWGGSFNYVSNLQDPFEDVESDANVWAIDVFDLSPGGAAQINATLVNVDNPLLGRFGASAMSKNSTVVVVSGQRARASASDTASYPANDVWRFVLNETAPADEPAGVWSQFIEDSANRFYYGATWASQGEELVVHGGQGRTEISSGVARDIAKADITTYKTSYLMDESFVNVTETSGRARRVSQDNVLYRLHHVMGSVGNTVFIYGGLQFVRTSAGGTVLQSNPFVALTSIDFENHKTSCELASGTKVAWCGFEEEFPTVSRTVSGVQRGDELVVLTQETLKNGTVVNQLWALDMAAVLTDGKEYLQNGYTLEAWGGTSTGLNSYFALQFSLIIVAIVGVCAIGIIHRSRVGRDSRFSINFNENRRRSYGVSKEVVDALPWIRFDMDGHYVRLRREVDDEGNETFVEVPGAHMIEKTSSMRSDASGPHSPRPGAPAALVRRESSESERPEAGHRSEHNLSRTVSNSSAHPDTDVEDEDGQDAEDDRASSQPDGERRPSSAIEGTTIVIERNSSKLSDLSDRVPSLISLGSRRLSKLSHGSGSSGADRLADIEGRPAISGATFNVEVDEEGELCSICLLEFEQDEPVKQLPCNHFFHGECIEPWLLKRGDCPLCKRHILTLRTIEEEEALRGPTPDDYQAHTDGEDREPAMVEGDVEVQIDARGDEPHAAAAAPSPWRRFVNYVAGSNSLRPEQPRGSSSRANSTGALSVHSHMTASSGNPRYRSPQ